MGECAAALELARLAGS